MHDGDGDGPRLQRLPAKHFVQVERRPLPITHGIHHHQRLTRAQLHDVAGREKVCIAQTPEPVDLDRAALRFELVRQPTERSPLSYSDNHIINGEALGWSHSVDAYGRSIDGAGEARRMQLQRLYLSIAQYGRHGSPVQKLHALLQHVVQIFRDRRHLLGIGFHGDHGHFLGASPERFARAIDCSISAADDGHPRSQLDL